MAYRLFVNDSNKKLDENSLFAQYIDTTNKLYPIHNLTQLSKSKNYSK